MLVLNPLDSPYFLPTLMVAGGLLVGILLLLLVLVRFDLSKLRASSLFHRWQVWAVIAPIYSLAILGGALPAFLLVSFLILQGLREYARLVGLPARYTVALLISGLLTPLAALLSIDAFRALPALVLLSGTLLPVLAHPEPGGVRHLAFTALGWGYIALFLSHLILIYLHVDGGQGILLTLALSVALSDVGAFVVGKKFGRHKMAPRLSPNKTWEGAIGNVLGAYLGTALMMFALPEDARLLLLGVLPLIVAVGAVWGDLFESSIKREFGAKDAGSWLPGFGGLLDRIDSLIVVLPLVYYLLTWGLGR